MRCDGDRLVNGAACEACNGTGEAEIKGCPKKQIDPSAYDVLAAADLSKHGSWPVGGGWMDQTEACIAGVRFVRADRAYWRGMQGQKQDE